MILSRAIDILAELVAFDTTSRNSNLALIAYIETMLDHLGIPHEQTFNKDRSKANLFATIGDANKPGLVLSGHTDVVPVDGQDWNTNPFQMHQHARKLYGRGTSDMKGFIAVCLAMAEQLKQAALPMPIHFAFSYDEEVGCLGVRGLILELEAREIKPLACIVGEPSNMEVISAHKGMYDCRCDITGCAGHSSLPNKGVNAIYVASKLVQQLVALGDDLRQNGPFDERFEPPYSTVHVGRISGGTVNNIIPGRCEFEYEIRNIPAHDPEKLANKIKQYAWHELLPDMQKVSEDTAIDWTLMAEFPSLDTPDQAAINDWMKKVLNTTSQPGGVSYGTEAGLFSEIGIETIVCGPGSINQAHRPNEFIEVEQMEKCISFMHSLIEHLQQGYWPDT